MPGYMDTKGNWSQRNQRQDVRFIDQHGREYHASIEVKSGAACGLIQPLYQAPLSVPMLYLERSTDPRRPYDLTVNYDRWISDIRLEQNGWLERARNLAIELDPQWTFDKEFRPDVLKRIGAKPQAVEPVIAARQGNSWILGFPNRDGSPRVPDIRLVKYFAPEQLDPAYLRKNEEDFTDAGLERLQAHLDRVQLERDQGTEAYDAELDFTNEDKLAHDIDELRPRKTGGPVTDDLDRRLDLEEQFDRNATGGKREEVRKPKSSEAERKAAYRDRKKREAKEALDALAKAELDMERVTEVPEVIAPEAAFGASGVDGGVEELVDAVTRRAEVTADV